MYMKVMSTCVHMGMPTHHARTHTSQMHVHTHAYTLSLCVPVLLYSILNAVISQRSVLAPFILVYIFLPGICRVL